MRGHSGTGMSTPSWRWKLPQMSCTRPQEFLVKGVLRTGFSPPTPTPRAKPGSETPRETERGPACVHTCRRLQFSDRRRLYVCMFGVGGGG